MSAVLSVENVSKQYRLGLVGSGTLREDLIAWWYKMRGLEDPTLMIGEENDRTKTGDSNYVWALKDINFEVQQGEVLGIIGKNGAGKSTLLKLLSRVTAPTTGSIKAKGRIASLLEVGTGFHPELTGRENIFLNGAIMGMKRHEINRKLDEIVAFAGVERYLDTPVKRYSSGMYVRLAFAVAAHLEPDILIVDEVLAVGDAEFQKKAIGKMKDVSSGEGRTVLFVSHNMASIKALCKSGILMHNGKISFSGTAGDTVDKYLQIGKTVSFSNTIPTDIPERVNNGLAQFKTVRLINSSKTESSSFYFREGFVVQLEIDVSEVIDDAIFMLALTDSNANRTLFKDTTVAYSSGMKLYAKKRYRIRFSVDAFLLPQNYYVEALITHSDGRTIDHVKNICSLEVIKTAQNKEEYYRWVKPWGYIMDKGKIDIEEL